jgi:hypothetical protein
MKHKNKKLLTGRQREGMMRNAHAMSAKTKGNYNEALGSMVLLIMSVKTIKGKLGFGINAPDGVFLLNSKAIFQAFTDDVGNFFAASPFALLATLNTQNIALDKSMKDVKMGVLDAEAAKIAAKAALKLTLDTGLDYVNGLARLNQAQAAEIITSAKMMVIAEKSVNKQDFAVKQGSATGEVKLIALAAKYNSKRVKACYDWQYSIDGGTTWIALDSTLVAKTVAAGMSVDVKTLFRKRFTTAKGGTTAWCNPIGITPQ